MVLQISSGQGPAECELAVGKLYQALNEEYPDMALISSRRSRMSDGYTSIIFSTDFDLAALEGSIQWICKSPYRPHHKRKNWFVDVSVLTVDKQEYNFKETELKFERFHCGGKGGQNVNKVETGVRLIHLPTGISVTSTAERSQYRNKEDALEKLAVILHQKEIEEEKQQVHNAWREHNRIIRGNPVRIYEGMDFRRKNSGNR
ncbi:MAG: peptide chain release factor H [Candidatus Limivivens sp.]|nr:peptide chain release factor H [Candidatus Limivivens sp.]